MHTVDIIIGAIWIAFWLYWLAASVTTKTALTSRSSSVGIRIAFVVVVLVSLRAGFFRGQRLVTNPWLQAVGLAVFLVGLAGAVWARVYLGRNWGTPMSEKVDPELVTTGPYRFVRHPIYSGIILGMIGTTLAVSLYSLVPAVLLGGYFVYSAGVEERTMERRFPDSYPAYKRSTKMLIPFIF